MSRFIKKVIVFALALTFSVGAMPVVSVTPVAAQSIMFATPPTLPGVPGIDSSYTPAENLIVIDDGYDSSLQYDGGPTNYNKWPENAALSNGDILVGWAKSHNHAAKGYFDIGLVHGDTVTYRPVTVDGDTIHTVAISMGLIDGRIHIAWQDNPNVDFYLEDYNNIHTAYIDEDDLLSDFMGCTFTGQTTTYFINADPDLFTVASVYGRYTKVGNELWLPYYTGVIDTTTTYPYTQTVSTCNYMVSTDSGVTWDTTATPILTRFGGAYPNGFTSEPAFIVTNNTGIKGTTEVVCLVRNEQYAYYTHLRSANGGGSWTDTVANGLFYGFSGASGERKPVDIIEYHDSMHIVCGNRNLDIDNSTPLYHIEEIVCTANTLWTNDGYLGGNTTPTSVLKDYVVNAITYSSGIHWGYPRACVRYYPEYGIDELIVHGYDASVLNTEPDEVRTIIFQYIMESHNTYPDPLSP